MKPPTQAAIARELGLSRAALTKMKGQGCPMDSADAVRRWRARHLVRSRTRPDPGPSARTLIERVHDLAGLAAVAQRIGRFELVADALRAALRDVPEDQRDAVRLAPWLWVALAGPLAWREVVGDEAGLGFRAADLTDAAPGELVPMGIVPYMLAAGELAP